MRAARYYGTEDIRVEEIEEPKCGEGQIKVKPAFVGICGTGTYFHNLYVLTDQSSYSLLTICLLQTSTNSSAAQPSPLEHLTP